MTSQSHYRRCFWKNVTIETYQEGEQIFYRPLLDGRSISLPKGHILQLSSLPLAEKIAEEWRNIEENSLFQAEDLSLSRIAGTMIERIEPAREHVIESLCAYGQDDAFCYQSPTYNEANNALIARKILEWLESKGLSPSITEGLMPVVQDRAYLEALKYILEEKSSAILASLGVLTPLLSSLLIPLALLESVITEEEAFLFGFSDELHQLKIWGEDSELVTLLERRKKDIRDSVSFYHLSLLNA